jgi:predicted PurR-regulated permease PerM
MKRGLATGLIMILSLVATVVFFAIFGNLLLEQLLQLIKALPDVVTNVIDWVNGRFGTDLDINKILENVGLTPGAIASWAAGAAGGIFGAVFSFLGSLFNVFTLLLFTFYLSADAPRLRRWIAKILPGSAQRVNSELWDVSIQKAGGYVAARLVLAFINGSTTALVLWFIGMPYWLPLGIWTGIVAQFVPTIGTYIAIALPVLIGLLSDDPKDGVIALVWALLYQQVENLTIEPRISAKAVDLHPAVSFGAVMFGASLFGAAGAVLAVPVAAIIMSFLETYAPKYDVVPEGAGPAG